MTTTIAKVELSTTCSCYECETCSISYLEEGRCSECDTQLTPAPYCNSICWDDSNNMAEYALEEYLKTVGQPEYLKIEGRAMGWQRLSGWATVKADWESLRNALRINGEYTLRMEITDDSFKVRRSSHDEPMGAYFTVSPAEGDDSEDN